MSYDRNTLALSLGFGAVSGMRSMSGLAFLSRHLSTKTGGRSHSAVVSLLATRGISKVITMMAAAEMVADKLPYIPSRTDPAPLIGRAASGALTGFAVSQHRGGNKLAGSLLGAVAAIGTTFLFHRIRKEVAARAIIPDWMTAGLEDALVLVAGSRLSERTD